MSDKNVSVYRQNEFCQVLEYILSPDRVPKDADSKTRIFDGFRLDVSSHWNQVHIGSAKRGYSLYISEKLRNIAVRKGVFRHGILFRSYSSVG